MRAIVDTSTGDLIVFGKYTNTVKISEQPAQLLNDFIALCETKDIAPSDLLKLTRIKYQKSKQVFSIKDTIHGDDITIKLESDVTDMAKIAVFDGLKAICTSLNTDWDIVQWYEPNILNVDSVEYPIMEMTDENKYIIWMAGEICKSFIVI